MHILYIAVLGRSELQQFAVYALHRQAHHIEIASAETGHADVANPLLYAIGSGLVERTAGGYIVVYLLVGKCLERYIGDTEKRLCLSDVVRQTPVTTQWVLPLSLCNMRQASDLSEGLPKISPSAITTVSAVMSRSRGFMYMRLRRLFGGYV